MDQAEALEHEAECLDVAVTGPATDVEGRAGVLKGDVELPGPEARPA